MPTPNSLDTLLAELNMYKDKEKEAKRRKEYYLENQESILIWARAKSYLKKHGLELVKIKRPLNIRRLGNCKKCGEQLMERVKNSPNVCFKCVAAQRKLWKSTRLAKLSEYERERSIRNRKKVIEHYGGNPPKCSCCGEHRYHFLTIDHINNDGGGHRRMLRSWNLSAWIVRHKFPEKMFAILCYNCNLGRARQPDKICPHKKESLSSLKPNH